MDITLPDPQTLLLPAEQARDEARLIVIDSPAMLTLVVSGLKTLSDQKDALIAKRKKITDPLDVSRKAAMDLFRMPIEYVDEAIGLNKQAIADWNQRERTRVALEQRRVDEEARKARQKAEDEAARVRAAAAEQARKLEEEARIAREAGNTEKAEQLETRADNKLETAEAKAAVLAQTAQALAVAPVVAGPIKAAGTRGTMRYFGEFTDEEAFKKFCADSWLHFLKIDEGAVNRHLMATKGKFSAPGLTVRNKESIAA